MKRRKMIISTGSDFTEGIRLDGYLEESRADGIAKAIASGKDVVEADAFTLQIDIDSDEDFERWKKGGEVLLNALNYRDIHILPSSSGLPHRHITISLYESADIWKRIALQMCLGSHITREALNSYRVLLHSECPIVFFEKPKEKPRRMIRIETSAEEFLKGVKDG
jgi:hypothetical protein